MIKILYLLKKPASNLDIVATKILFEFVLSQWRIQDL